MIYHFPSDFSTHTYDLKTDDDLIWKFTQEEDDSWVLVSGDLKLPLLAFNKQPTFFTEGYVNINVHGFTIDDQLRTLTEAIPNENWVEQEPIPYVEEEDPLHQKERLFTHKLQELATRFNVDLSTLPDINIGTLLSTATTAGATEMDIANASALLLALAKDVEAESNLNWAETWQGLKSRIPAYLAELAKE